MECWFYHLEQTDVAATLPPLLERCRQRGWRALVRSPLPERLDALDALLWTYRDDSWLPHAVASGSDADTRQPVLLSALPGNGNAAQAVFRLDGAEEGSLDGVERVFVLFDGRDDEAVQRARADFKAARSAGHDMAYWRQDGDGTWTRQA